jgi:hypothetical protein
MADIENILKNVIFIGSFEIIFWQTVLEKVHKMEEKSQ